MIDLKCIDLAGALHHMSSRSRRPSRTDDQRVKLKEGEIRSFGPMPHPFEYKMYFNL
jgi:hypothetical protein